jgi:hypothetical protein
LAVQHPSVYGVAAVLIALLIGLGIDSLAALLRRKLRRLTVRGEGWPATEEASKQKGKGAGVH